MACSSGWVLSYSGLLWAAQLYTATSFLSIPQGLPKSIHFLLSDLQGKLVGPGGRDRPEESDTVPLEDGQ